MQLATPHKGWENEHLATFLLSRIAFVASPITVADDIGTDIFCTLFEVAKHKGRDVLLPRSSIAVQIKSNMDAVDVASKLDYLHRLEVPYYLGVVDQKQLTLALFSARFLPAFLSWQPHAAQLLLTPVDEFQENYRTTEHNDKGVYTLLCHKVATLNAHDDASAIAQSAAAIRDDSKAALQAIASRLNQEYVYEIPGRVEVFAGPGSAETFRHSFFKRLAEAYFNLSFLLDNKHPASEAEMDAFIAVADELRRAGRPVPEYVMQFREGLQNRRKGCHVEAQARIPQSQDVS
jgi:hypothetical protein